MDVNLENNKILTIPALALILALAVCNFGANVILSAAAFANAENQSKPYSVLGYSEKTSPCGNYGDVDSDGKVSFADATYLYDNMDNLASNSMGDVNGNGVLDFDDVVLINSYMEGTIQTFPVCNILKEKKKSKYSDGTLIRTSGDSKVYIVEEGEKVWIKTSEEFRSSGYEWRNVKTIPAQEMEGIGERVREAKLIMKDRKVYRLENGRLIWVPTVAAFNAQGLKWEEVGGSDANTETYEESRLIKDSRGNIYYITNNGKKKLVPNMDVFRSYGNKAGDVVEVSDEIISSMENVSLMRSKDDTKVYKIENRQKRWIKTLRSFQELGLKWEDIDIVNENEIETYPEGNSIE